MTSLVFLFSKHFTHSAILTSKHSLASFGRATVEEHAHCRHGCNVETQQTFKDVTAQIQPGGPLTTEVEFQSDLNYSKGGEEVWKWAGVGLAKWAEVNI